MSTPDPFPTTSASPLSNTNTNTSASPPERIEPVPEGAEALIGYEPRTVEFDPRNPAEAREFLTAYREALANGGRVLPVRGRRGKLAVWQEAVEFWRGEEGSAAGGQGSG
jgi:hypothetical protein